MKTTTTKHALKLSLLLAAGLLTTMTTEAATDAPAAKRTKPPIIILKLDDLSQQYGAIVPRFVTMAKLLEERNIKGSFGLICDVTWDGAQPLEESGPAYLNQVKKWHDGGLIEIWFHGWDHGGHVVDGENCCEFYGRTFEEVKDRFARGQKTAEKMLGFNFTAFGAGGGKSKYPSFDDTVCKVLAQDPHIKVWFYAHEFTDAAHKLQAEGNVVVLERVGHVNLEKRVGQPDFEWFKKGYDANPDKEYFVLQGHPNTWDEARFAEVAKIIDFLIAERAVFMTPTEYAASVMD